MSFKRLDPQDFLVSADSVASPAWSSTLATLSSASMVKNTTTVGGNSVYYREVLSTTNEGYFSVSYGDGAATDRGTAETNYKRYRTLILEDETAKFAFGNGVKNHIHILTYDRSRYKESVLPGTFQITLSGSGNNRITLTDNSNLTSTIPYLKGTKAYDLVQGTGGSGSLATNNESYGKFIPDMGLIIFNTDLISGSLQSYAPTTPNVVANLDTIADSIIIGNNFTSNAQETITSDYVFIRARNNEFNYSTNPSYISGSSGEIIYPSFITSPVSYLTTVGLYNDTNELIAVAKLSKPLQKDFTKEMLLRVKLDF